MVTETVPLKTSIQRVITAAVILCTMYLISYAIVGQSPPSRFNPTRNLFQIFFATLQAGPLVLLWQWIRYRRFEPAVMLWAAYGGGWLLLILLSQNIPLGLLFYPIIIVCSSGVFLYATILLSAEIRTRRFDVTTFVATIVLLFSSGQVLVDAALNPIVI